MEMLNNAIEGADAFKKLMEQIEPRPAGPIGNRGPGTPEATGHENRQQRRARERAERKSSAKA